MRRRHHPHLQRRHEGEARHAPQEDENGAGHGERHGDGERHQQHRQRCEGDDQRAIHRAVGEAAAQPVADGEADAIGHQHRGDEGHRCLCLRLQDRRDIGEDREHRAGADHRQGQRRQHRAASQNLDLGEHVAAGVGGDGGQRQVQSRHRHDADRGDAPEGGAPADLVAGPGGQRHADDVGDGQAHEHGGDGGGAPVLRHQPRRDDRADAEKGAVVQRGDQPCDQQHAVAGRHRRHQVAEGEDPHEADQQGTARHAAGGERHHRRAQHDADGVGADEQAGGRDRHTKIAGDGGQEPHRREFGDADAEGAGGQGEKGRIEFHIGALRSDGEPVASFASAAGQNRSASVDVPRRAHNHTNGCGRPACPGPLCRQGTAGQWRRDAPGQLRVAPPPRG